MEVSGRLVLKLTGGSATTKIGLGSVSKIVNKINNDFV